MSLQNKMAEIAVRLLYFASLPSVLLQTLHYYPFYVIDRPINRLWSQTCKQVYGVSDKLICSMDVAYVYV